MQELYKIITRKLVLLFLIKMWLKKLKYFYKYVKNGNIYVSTIQGLHIVSVSFLSDEVFLIFGRFKCLYK